MGDFLLCNADSVIVEDSPVDAFWGADRAADDAPIASPAGWVGLNLLGFALVKGRAALRAWLPPASAGPLWRPRYARARALLPGLRQTFARFVILD